MYDEIIQDLENTLTAAENYGRAADLTMERQAERIKDLEAERYLPVPCPICGRLRLQYRPGDRTSKRVECEKCGADADVLYDSDAPDWKRLAVVTSAYTGILCARRFSDVHAYIEEVLGRSVLTHEIPGVMDELKVAASPEFMRLWGLTHD